MLLYRLETWNEKNCLQHFNEYVKIAGCDQQRLSYQGTSSKQVPQSFMTCVIKKLSFNQSELGTKGSQSAA